MNMTTSVGDRIFPLISTGKTRLAGATLALFGLLADCEGQGTMRFEFEGQAPGTFITIGEYSASGVWFWNPYSLENLALVGSGVSWGPDNGTAYLATSLHAGLAFKFTSPTQFNLVSFDLAERSPSPQTVQVVGYKNQELTITVTTNLTTDGIMDATGPLQDFQTFQLDPRFVDLYRVDISPGGWSLDNLVLRVPEPSGAALALLGAACAFWFNRLGRRHHA